MEYFSNIALYLELIGVIVIFSASHNIRLEIFKSAGWRMRPCSSRTGPLFPPWPAMANEETAEELADMLAEADSLAEPAVLFGVCPVETRESVQIGKLPVDVPLVEEKLRGKSRCFPYVATCGAALEN